MSETPKGVYVEVRIQPKSSKNSIEGVHENFLKIKLSAPPVDGEANRALIEFLAETLGLKKSQIDIEVGIKSRNKLLRIHGPGTKGLQVAFRGLIKRA